MYIIREGPGEADFDCLPYTQRRDMIIFLNDPKGCGNDYLDPLPDEFRPFSRPTAP